MKEQIPFFREDANELVERAYDEHKPRKVFCLFSGGNDSTVLLHWANRKILTHRPLIDGAVHIDTGTALPGVREFVEKFCADLRIPLLVYEAGDAFERLVLERSGNQERPFGFPGPGQHPRAYQRIKERQVRKLAADHKKTVHDRIMLVTGVRRQESQRRMGLSQPINRVGSQVWVNPLIDWTDREMRDYRAKWNVPQSDVAALMHRSGECNCGAFAAPGERQDIATFYPEFDAWLTDLERRAELAGAQNCKWGSRPDEPAEPAGPMCSDCQLRLEAA